MKEQKEVEGALASNSKAIDVGRDLGTDESWCDCVDEDKSGCMEAVEDVVRDISGRVNTCWGHRGD